MTLIPIRTESWTLTDPGIVRKHNEDSFYASDKAGLWLVADGMGGLERGEWASALVVAAVSAAVSVAGQQGDVEGMLAAVTGALEQANEQILTESERVGKQMGSTAVALCIRDNRFGIAWVGDSRAYLLRANRLYRLTRDHSQVQELLDRGLIEESAAASHPLRNVLTRAVGVARPLQVDTVVDALQDDDLLLLCSDGLYGVLGEAEMQEVLRSMPFERAAGVMLKRCLELGAPDNVTLVGVATSEVTLAHFGHHAPEI